MAKPDINNVDPAVDTVERVETNFGDKKIETDVKEVTAKGEDSRNNKQETELQAGVPVEQNSRE